MKKMMALVLSILVLLAGFTTAMAVGTIDFSGYSLEELLEISSDLADEIASAPAEKRLCWVPVSIRLAKVCLQVSTASSSSRMETVMFREPITTSTKVNPCTNTILIGYGLVTCPEWRGTSWVMVKRGSAFIPVNT